VRAKQTLCPRCATPPAALFPLALLPWPLEAVASLRKHGVSFELPATLFSDPRLLTVADLEHSAWRYFSVKAEQKGIDPSELRTDVLKRYIRINEALK
jgi:uncharacterized DUF497 family protein